MTPKKNLTKIPLHEILLDNGYFYKKDKNSQAWKVLTNSNEDTIVISKKPNGDYLYYSTKNDYDRGNIYNFCKNREIKTDDLLSEKNIAEYKDDIQVKTNHSDKFAINKYKELQTIQNINYFTQDRKIDKDYLSLFTGLKSDNYNNIAIPTYIIKKPLENEILSQSGFVKYLKTPLTQSANGEIYDKPIKQLCYGSKGLEIIKPNNTNSLNEIKSIIICESSIDSLSLAQMNSFNANSTLICATNGQFAQSHKKILEFLKEKATNAEFILGFDNDEAGKKYKEKALEIIPNAKTIKPILKDFNDDLMVSNILNIDPANFEKKTILNKIIDINKTAQEYIKKHSFLTPMGKEQKLKELREYYKAFNEVKPKIEKTINFTNLENSFNEIINIQNKQNSKTR